MLGPVGMDVVGSGRVCPSQQGIPSSLLFMAGSSCLYSHTQCLVPCLSTQTGDAHLMQGACEGQCVMLRKLYGSE